MTLIILAIAWMLGIVVADLLPLPLPLLVAVAVTGGLLAAALGRQPRLRLAALALCCAALGGGRLELAQVAATPRSICNPPIIRTPTLSSGVVAPCLSQVNRPIALSLRLRLGDKEATPRRLRCPPTPALPS